MLPATHVDKQSAATQSLGYGGKQLAWDSPHSPRRTYTVARADSRQIALALPGGDIYLVSRSTRSKKATTLNLVLRIEWLFIKQQLSVCNNHYIIIIVITISLLFHDRHLFVVTHCMHRPPPDPYRIHRTHTDARRRRNLAGSVTSERVHFRASDRSILIGGYAGGNDGGGGGGGGLNVADDVING